ncbi:hypothetical protein AAFF_G00099210 [Aldrovandia affinis]|uniref:Uncharacterized protein n=1 Tax=Aldrovandia affinis TaxID=143900 RepID=A0AAD7RUW0_9TELE|nr:hypothetical protein AAFF_G00099210 [Aldrovandia affinis]
MQQINADIEYLKRTTDTQTTACETLRVVSATLNNRLTAVEKPRGQGATSSAASLSAAEIQPGPVPGSSSAVVERPLGPGETEDIQPAQPDDSAQGRTQSPAWSKVVREGRRQKQVPENSDQQRHIPRTVKTLARHERKKTGIIGTGVVSNILAVKTKMVSVFATKFDLNVDADTLSDYLKEKLGREVKCRKSRRHRADSAPSVSPLNATTWRRCMIRSSGPLGPLSDASTSLAAQRSGRRPVRTRGNPSPSGNWAAARW